MGRSRRIHRVLALMAGLMLLASVAITYRAITLWRRIFIGAARPHRMAVAPGVVGIWTGASYAYVLTTPGQQAIALIDAGSDPDGRALETELHRQGHAGTDVSHIFLTHGHADHVAGLAHFAGAQIHAHIDEAALIWGDEAPKREALRMYLRLHGKADVQPFLHPLLAGQQLMHGQHHIEVVPLHGHTRGSVGFATACGLIAGDAVDWVPSSAWQPKAEGLGCASPLPRSYNERPDDAARSGCRALKKAPRWLATGHNGLFSAVGFGPEDRCPPRQAEALGP